MVIFNSYVKLPEGIYIYIYPLYLLYISIVSPEECLVWVVLYRNWRVYNTPILRTQGAHPILTKTRYLGMARGLYDQANRRDASKVIIYIYIYTYSLAHIYIYIYCAHISKSMSLSYHIHDWHMIDTHIYIYTLYVVICIYICMDSYTCNCVYISKHTYTWCIHACRHT